MQKEKLALKTYWVSYVKVQNIKYIKLIFYINVVDSDKPIAILLLQMYVNKQNIQA